MLLKPSHHHVFLRLPYFLPFPLLRDSTLLLRQLLTILIKQIETWLNCHSFFMLSFFILVRLAVMNWAFRWCIVMCACCLNMSIWLLHCHVCMLPQHGHMTIALSCVHVVSTTSYDHCISCVHVASTTSYDHCIADLICPREGHENSWMRLSLVTYFICPWSWGRRARLLRHIEHYRYDIELQEDGLRRYAGNYWRMEVLWNYNNALHTALSSPFIS
jgi:hypothetical protein